MTVYAGQGSMALLWRAGSEPRAKPGPKPGLSVDLIVDTAIAVADEVGMAALSMRTVGERLGRTAMALYTYVPNKGELVDLMYDRALAQLPTGYDLSDGWRAALTRWAGDSCDFHVRHPWVLQVSQARPVLGPNEFAMLDTLARILAATGLPPQVLRGIVPALFDVVRGAARTIAEARQAPSQTGMSDEEWWQARSTLLLQVAPDFAERFPMAHWLESGGGEASPPPDAGEPYLERAARQAFRSGLTVLLDGIEAAGAA
ncbi:TetR/AcrR family transcriptional regulator [Nonomuraea sp. NPDC059194]|uniref:TetR/AcrR family transcriptional regulator n=1 Tax=Nonomuraea sp. NPDC059194 TaxID=3346764 RepID=UPI003696EE4A